VRRSSTHRRGRCTAPGWRAGGLLKCGADSKHGKTPPRQPRWVGASYFALGPNAGDHAAKYINANYGYNPDLAARRLRTLPASDQAVTEAIQRQQDMGVDEFILRPCAEEMDQMDRLGEIAARVR
jgi:hypothetical protein